ncbi:recombinase RecT [Novosphingobium fluoreni]|uniref:recombinase RecT n=1 Tax=Novosphingobium fluoreni TaxID=1391222 RepID=UPI003DA09026
MNAVTQVQQPRRELAPIEVLKNTVSRKADDFKTVLPSHITVDKFQRTIATAALKNPQLMNCDRQSLLLAAMQLAQDGLLPDGREAALVPFKSRVKDGNQWIDKWQVQAMPMAWGLRKKILQSGEVLSLQVGVVYEDEIGNGFLYEIGIEPPVRHRPDLMAKAEDRTDDKIVAAYSIARIKNGDAEPLWSAEVMPRHEIDKVRQASQTGAVGKTTRDGKAIAPKGPWVDWFSEMAKKSVLRRHSKMLPMSGDILDTLERDDAEERRAQGAARLLEAEEHKPTALPGRDEWNTNDVGGGDDEQVDVSSGEVIQQDARGMTQTGEEIARALDGNDGTLGEENPNAAEGPADEQRGEANTRVGDEPIWAQHVRGIRGSIAAAKTVRAIDQIERDWTNRVMNGVGDDDLVREVEAEFAAKKRELKAKQEG